MRHGDLQTHSLQGATAGSGARENDSGLRLAASEIGAKKCVFRFTIDGKLRDKGLSVVAIGLW